MHMTSPDSPSDDVRSMQSEQASSPELSALIDRLDARGESLRTRANLTEAVYAASVDELPVPASYDITRSSSSWVVGRIALAACVLIAFAVSARLLLTGTVQPQAEERVQASASPVSIEEMDSILATESDTVLVSLLDAGRNGRISNIEGLEGSDPVGAAFAPILGTTGIGFDDYLAEISLIEVELRR